MPQYNDLLALYRSDNNIPADATVEKLPITLWQARHGYVLEWLPPGHVSDMLAVIIPESETLNFQEYAYPQSDRFFFAYSVKRNTVYVGYIVRG